MSEMLHYLVMGAVVLVCWTVAGFPIALLLGRIFHHSGDDWPPPPTGR